METKIAKVLDNGHRVVVDLKKNRTAYYDAYIARGTQKLSSKRTASNSPINKVVKRRKLDGSNKKTGCCDSQFKTSLLKNYSNFTKSGIPQRVMFYQNDDWNDFPRDIITMIRKDLQMKKAAIEVRYNGNNNYVLDFLHMVRLDMKTGFTLPMAWIDESGRCFFPSTFSCDDDSKGGQDEFSGSAHQDIKLHLEIEVKGSDHSKLKECSGDSDDFVKKVPDCKKFDSGRCNMEVEGSCAKPSDIGESKQIEKNGMRNIEHGELDSDAVRKLFLVGIGSSVCAEIVDLCRSASSLMQARLELFYKQMEIMNKYRGDANVRYAWFRSTKAALSSIMTYGLGLVETSEVNSTYGVGVHLLPVNCAFNSASDIDENGVQHLVLCRVIMGKMELVLKGSKQFHPSGDDFDSGVDDLQNPSHYIVWNMNKNTHIYPEYGVSFKVSSDTAGFVANNAGKLDNSGVTACSPEPPKDPPPLDKSPAHLIQEKVPSVGSSTLRTPKSPWVSFSTLLAAVSDKISPEYMKMLESEYGLFRSKKITRLDFVRKLRLAVGENLLKSVITENYSKLHGGNESKELAGKVDFSADKVMPKSEIP